ncbi:phage baseplate assembly protein V [Halotia branconii]|uniref:Phage baseplate assembly protein V n=1 Tax=Halotia branconii CENA392 TaxID=1539056 RepID=A0AAJ6PBM9_9CYAN|nr:phage baseplate assembly protein V [Halotia branconii]WGV28001.1 phage baseplate assembly protein V [Halotia branconii CENA392]
MNNLYNYSLKTEDRGNGALIKGVTLATVTNISELGKGRVKVKFQWRKYNQTNDEISARIITSDKNISPSIEVHDVVLVAFEQGVFEYPFIIGFVWPHLKDTES